MSMFPVSQGGGLGLFGTSTEQMGGKHRCSRRRRTMRRRQRGGNDPMSSSAVKAVQNALNKVTAGAPRQTGGRRRRSRRRGSRRSRKHRGGAIGMLA